MLDSLLCKRNMYIPEYIYSRYLSLGLRFFKLILRKCVGCWSQTYFMTLRQPELILGQIEHIMQNIEYNHTLLWILTTYIETTPPIWIIFKIRTGICTRGQKIKTFILTISQITKLLCYLKAWINLTNLK